MRLFIAVNLSQEVKRSIRTAVQHFPIADPPWRWVKDEALHITLKFLGDTPEDQIPHIINQMCDTCRTHKSFHIRLESLGGFPNLKKPRVLFYRAVEGNDVLSHIAGDINTSLFDGLGIPVERKPFRAHVTIARIKRPLPREITSRFGDAPALAQADQMVRSIDLMSSELRREGARYQLVKGIALDPPA
jgi:2'-5' RNA ligase